MHQLLPRRELDDRAGETTTLRDRRRRPSDDVGGRTDARHALTIGSRGREPVGPRGPMFVRAPARVQRRARCALGVRMRASFSSAGAPRARWRPEPATTDARVRVNVAPDTGRSTSTSTRTTTSRAARRSAPRASAADLRPTGEPRRRTAGITAPTAPDAPTDAG